MMDINNSFKSYKEAKEKGIYPFYIMLCWSVLNFKCLIYHVMIFNIVISMKVDRSDQFI